ncbi:hypothetical protein SB2_11935 [Methylobacterium radiotolerans]|nr:hypothetical protein SB3_11130 [Methylobacterium radiotolerans]KTS48000.1 hypothetical protein SB2_11935 [Methylobacterium radiotolerans]
MPAPAEAISTAQKTADVFLAQGPMGAVVVAESLLLIVAGFAIWKLYSDKEGLISKLLQVASAMEASKNATERFEDALQALRATLETRGQTVADLSQRVELMDRDLKHGLGNLSAALNGIANFLQRGRRSAPLLGSSQEQDDEWGPR